MGLKGQVPHETREQIWVSFDGMDQEQLSGVDALIHHMVTWLVATICDKNF